MSINIDLSNKRAIVTGVSRGIGWSADLNYDEIANHPNDPNNYLPLFRSGWEKRQTVT